MELFCWSSAKSKLDNAESCCRHDDMATVGNIFKCKLIAVPQYMVVEKNATIMVITYQYLIKKCHRENQKRL
jgi:hypothetical protein